MVSLCPSLPWTDKPVKIESEDSFLGVRCLTDVGDLHCCRADMLSTTRRSDGTALDVRTVQDGECPPELGVSLSLMRLHTLSLMPYCPPEGRQE